MKFVYFDSHFVDYLWDHRAYVWDDNDRSIRRAKLTDTSTQIEEYEALSGFPDLLWLNG